MNSLAEHQNDIRSADSSIHRNHSTPDGGRCQAQPARRPRRARRDDESRNRVVQANMGLVYRVARHYLNQGLTLEDLVGEGNLGLIRAAQQYDPKQGTRFSTYATYWIRDAIQSALAKTGATIRLPVNVARLLKRWQRIEKSLRDRHGYQPTFEEVAAAMGLDRRTQRLISKAHRVARLLKPAASLTDGGTADLLMRDESATAEESLDAREERESVSRRLERLGRTERTVVNLRYGLSGEPPMTFSQIADRLRIPATEVQRTVALAMRMLGRQGDVQAIPPLAAPKSRVG